MNVEKSTSASLNHNTLNDNIYHKQHYKLYFFSKEVDTMNYHKAIINFTNLNQFRYFNKRRLIRFDNNMVAIELFSVQEMEKLFGKRIIHYSSETEIAEKTRFHISNGIIKEQL